MSIDSLFKSSTSVFAVEHLELSLPTPEAHLACDEILLDRCEAEAAAPLLWFWEPHEPFVVVGYANRVRDEVNVEACRAAAVRILRRLSGGGTVLQGPGCLNYSLVLPVSMDARMESIAGTNRFIMERHRRALEAMLDRPVQVQGHTDLTLGPLKFSGNAQRRKRRAVLFHGTFLLDLDLALMEELLRLPPKEPAYRHGRTHRDFVTNLRVPAATVKRALRQCWEAEQPARSVPCESVEALARTRYSREEWNLRW